jgi:type IV secretion system protein TrbG
MKSTQLFYAVAALMAANVAIAQTQAASDAPLPSGFRTASTTPAARQAAPAAAGVAAPVPPNAGATATQAPQATTSPPCPTPAACGSLPARKPMIHAHRAGTRPESINGPYPDPDDPSLVTYDYDPDYSYRIITEVDQETHILLAPDEEVVGVYLADTGKRWPYHTSITKRDLFISARAAGLRNTGTIITSKRRYEIDLRSTSSNAWYHRVSWHYTDAGTSSYSHVTPFGTEYPGNIPRGSGYASGGTSDSSGPRIDLTHANYSYQVKGDAPFAPTMVFDDGQFTYMKLPHNAALSAVFILDRSGNGEITDLAPIGNDFYKIPQVASYGLLLQRGKDEVRVFNQNSRGCGLFGCDSESVRNLYGKS